ncbi:hypothetical protein [Lentzea fradiae]|uniref:hypothetical protein n=1 Tax=Lentzea fradiae TaxID=200378 RepID=UPI00115FBD60|nr:hypothetical protein [Lentzea fradiae]
MVTETEYRTAIDGFVSCMRKFDYDVTDPVLSPIDGLTLLYDLHPTGDPDTWNKNLDGCDSSFVSQIEPVYVEARTQVMEPSLRDATAQCLAERGADLGGEERNVKNFVDTTGNSDNIVMRCVSDAMKRLFPDYPGFLKIRW